MIARLELSKGTATENFSANMTSERRSDVSNASIEVAYPRANLGIEDESWEGTIERYQVEAA